jgi:hypothetical protein
MEYTSVRHFLAVTIHDHLSLLTVCGFGNRVMLLTW